MQTYSVTDLQSTSRRIPVLFRSEDLPLTSGAGLQVEDAPTAYFIRQNQSSPSRHLEHHSHHGPLHLPTAFIPSHALNLRCLSQPIGRPQSATLVRACQVRYKPEPLTNIASAWSMCPKASQAKTFGFRVNHLPSYGSQIDSPVSAGV